MTPLVHEIAGLAIPELAQQFGTPLYVYDARTILERIGHLAAFDVVRYAQKACSNIAILDLVRKNNVLVDAVSAGEIHRAMAAGYKPGFNDPPEIVYTADIFDHQTLDMVVELGVPVNCGSPDMISQYGQRAPGNSITLRINPGFGHGHSQKTNTGGEQSKHGIWHEQIEDCIERANEHGLTIAGLHMHIGSGTDMEHLSQVSSAMEQAALVVGSSITSISAGGGLPTPYRDGDDLVDTAAYYEQWDATRGRLAKEFGHHVSLEIEPGRYLAAESGYLVAEVRAVKQMGGNRYYLLDAGFNNLARPIMYGSYHPMAVCPANGDTERAHQQVVVGGPLCESGDIFTQEDGGFVSSRSLPEAHVGDYVVIGCAGAYGHTMASNYNSKPLTAEVLISDGSPHLIRERQSLDDLIRHERIPG
ncbi:diaminopimelate decarboxylase [Aeoliella sp. ICT_H6.2]|uniref:Diaminopimelate decarboxylase n=1 Tax=Aeoliella straminimaris TaxID=2954799 RepID=A0A9X2FHU2_9BACT|nr:diaminopimelate decarboxylase [Aeoliella straminimaris]MCO6046476.1 diaminopimelate decarboxylase [Aeoliella straminimaris]